MDTGDTGSRKSIHDLVEKIVTDGTMTSDDQNQINQLAFSGAASPADMTAIQNLTSLIFQGKIVVN